MPHVNETNWDIIVEGNELDDISVYKAKESIEISVNTSEIASYLDDGYTIKKEGVKKSTLTKPKKIGDSFEDEVWTIFYKMGFKKMNKDNTFAVVYSPENNLSKQIDVVAIDDEICLLIECKESETFNTSRNFQMDINEVPSFYNKVCNKIKEKYGDLKFKYIFATKNCNVSDQDKGRMKENGIIHFDYSTVLYYKALVSHLGKAAKYQLLGQIFAGQRIANMDMKVPAIRGKMGGLTYYSFLMTPEKLLKIGYVLHKTNANNDYEDLLPSYQRLIKKERLQSVREFINSRNYFPNSIIISIDSKRPLVFNPAPADYNSEELSKIGILNLPQLYQSAYIIDGQHRLYGYSDSNYASNNSIPVVAFENLDKRAQLKLFMEINLNQKAVPKALRNILEIEIYYDSDDKVLAQGALFGNIAKSLGERTGSALKGRVIIGEDAGTKRCCITIENIKLALAQTRFFNKIKRGGIQTAGIFEQSNNAETFNKVFPIIFKYFNYLKDTFESEWLEEDSFYVKNNIVGAYIRLLSDIVCIAYDNDNNCINDVNVLWDKCKNHLEILSLVLSDLSSEERGQILKEKGAAAPGNVYRLIQMKMFELDSSFTNNDIETYYVEHYKNYNDEAKPEILTIKDKLVDFSKNTFSGFNNWMTQFLSEPHENELTAKVSQTNISNSRNHIYSIVSEWDVMDFSDLKKMISQGSNWTNYYKSYFCNLDSTFTKDKVVSLIDTINSCDAKIKNGHKITGTDFQQIEALYNKLNEE